MANRFAFLQDGSSSGSDSESSDGEQQQPVLMPLKGLKNGSHKAAAPPQQQKSPSPLQQKVHTPNKTPAKPAADCPKTSVRPAKKSKSKGTTVNNAFAALALGGGSDSDDSDDDSDDDSEDESDSDADMGVTPRKSPAPAVVAPPTMPTIPQQHVDYYAVLNLKTSVAQEKIPSEILHFGMLFVNAKTKQCDFDFQMYVYPQSRQVSAETTEQTGIMMEDVKVGQPLDEVLRLLQAQLKAKNLVSANRKSKKPQPLHLQEQSFLVVADTETMKRVLLPDVTRKNIAPPTFLKKWVDLQKTFQAAYGKGTSITSIADMLHLLCLQSAVVPTKYQEAKIDWAATFDLTQVLTTLLTDKTEILANEEA